MVCCGLFPTIQSPAYAEPAAPPPPPLSAAGFILAGAFVGEKALNGTVDSMWESNNKGKLFKDMAPPPAAEA